MMSLHLSRPVVVKTCRWLVVLAGGIGAASLFADIGPSDPQIAPGTPASASKSPTNLSNHPNQPKATPSGITINPQAGKPAVPSATKPPPGIKVDARPGPEKTDPKASIFLEKYQRFHGDTQDLVNARRKFRELKSLQIEGRWVEGPREFRFTAWKATPGRFMLDRTRKDQGWDYRTRLGTDGVVAWSQELLPVKMDPVLLAPSQSLNLEWLAEFPDPLLEWPNGGTRFSHQGEVKIGGLRTVMLKAHLPNGSERFYYLHPDKGSLVCVGLRYEVAGKPVDIDVFPTQMKKVAGVLLETAWQFRLDGKTFQEIFWEKIEANHTPPAGLFTPPSPSQSAPAK